MNFYLADSCINVIYIIILQILDVVRSGLEYHFPVTY